MSALTIGQVIYDGHLFAGISYALVACMVIHDQQDRLARDHAYGLEEIVKSTLEAPRLGGYAGWT